MSNKNNLLFPGFALLVINIIRSEFFHTIRLGALFEQFFYEQLSAWQGSFIVPFHWQVGIPILGVVENMSGLRQAASEFAFKRADANGKEEDVTDKILDLLKQHLGSQVHMTRAASRNSALDR